MWQDYGILPCSDFSIASYYHRQKDVHLYNYYGVNCTADSRVYDLEDTKLYLATEH